MIDSALNVTDIGKPPHYSRKNAAKRLSATPVDRAVVAELVRDIYDRIVNNHRSAEFRRPSRENWRFRDVSKVDGENPSFEKSLESAIARIGGRDWVSQVPTASGLVGSSERQRNIDLVHRLDDESFEFIELKWSSNNPVFAAFEILKNGLVYLYSRRHREALQYNRQENPLLWARDIDLVTLAPSEYYQGYRFGWLEEAIDLGLADLHDASVDAGLRLCLRFERFPDGFTWKSRDEFQTRLTALETATRGRQPVWRSSRC